MNREAPPTVVTAYILKLIDKPLLSTIGKVVLLVNIKSEFSKIVPYKNRFFTKIML
jgi:hypothetical protein